MSIDTNLAEVLTNLQPTAEVILKSREIDFDNDSYLPFDGLLTTPLRQATEHYHGGDFFLRNLRDAKKPWSIGQARAVANIYRRALRGEARQGDPAAPKSERKYDCFYCPKGSSVLVGLDALYQHQADVHQKGRFYKAGNTPNLASTAPDMRGAYEEPAWGAPSGAVVPVLPDYVPEFNVDLRAFLPARFCVEDKTGTLRFFIVTELKRRSRLSGKFVWTKFRYANEYLEKGDRTVREQIGDTKKFIGKQRIEQPVYFGEEEYLLLKISENPDEAMTRYGIEKGVCAYCGKSLTDGESRKRGIGPDCWINKHIPQSLRFARQAVTASQS